MGIQAEKAKLSAPFRLSWTLYRIFFGTFMWLGVIFIQLFHGQMYGMRSGDFRYGLPSTTPVSRESFSY